MRDIKINLGAFALVALIIFCWGEPDLIDAIIYKLMECK